MLTMLANSIITGILDRKFVTSFADFYPITYEEYKRKGKSKKPEPRKFSDEEIEKLIGKRDV